MFIQRADNIIPLPARLEIRRLCLIIVGDASHIPRGNEDAILYARVSLIWSMTSALDRKLHIWILVQDLDGRSHFLRRLRQDKTSWLGIAKGSGPVGVTPRTCNLSTFVSTSYRLLRRRSRHRLTLSMRLPRWWWLRREARRGRPK